MSDEIKPCPFCGNGSMVIDPKQYWTGMRNQIISVEIRHWCEEGAGVSGSMIIMLGKTEAEALEKWNRRASGGQGGEGA